MIFVERKKFDKLLENRGNFKIYVVFIGIVYLLKLCKLILSVYEYGIWSNEQVNALEHDLMFRLWFKMFLTIFEMLCFIITLMLLYKLEFRKNLLDMFKEYVHRSLVHLALAWIIVAVYLLNSLLFVIYHVCNLIFICCAYVYLKCSGSDFEAPEASHV